ncbi:MAG: hypothetical protein ACRD22_17710, partial [Terriglobia bacterium]
MEERKRWTGVRLTEMLGDSPTISPPGLKGTAAAVVLQVRKPLWPAHEKRTARDALAAATARAHRTLGDATRTTP